MYSALCWFFIDGVQYGWVFSTVWASLRSRNCKQLECNNVFKRDFRIFGKVNFDKNQLQISVASLAKDGRKIQVRTSQTGHRKRCSPDGSVKGDQLKWFMVWFTQFDELEEYH